MFRKQVFVCALMLLGAGFGASSLHAQNDGDVRPVRATTQLPTVGKVIVTPEVEHGYLPSLRNATPPPDETGDRTHFEGLLPLPPGSSGNADGALQPRILAPALQTPSPLATYLGIGKGFTGPSGSFTVQSAPPDTVGAVGKTQYVQVVNSSFAVFNKSNGTVLLGPKKTNTLWSTLAASNGCRKNNDGDGVVVYDKAADRWVISQFSVSSTPFLQCVAVSQTSDATGGWYVYSFSSYNNYFNDYPKMGVWPDAYYETFNMFNAAGTAFYGSNLCAYDRASMLTGASATQQCYQLSSSYGGVLPADLDGSTPPPAGSPNYMVMWDTNSLDLWKFHVDWTTPTNTTVTGPINIPVASFSYACDIGGNNDGTCIPQKGTTNTLDSLSDRLMFRFAYRNFGDHESLVVSHSVQVGATTAGQTGVRWYELRDPNGTPTVYQQSTYSPDSALYRWMPSIAMDQQGNIAVGYSTSSGTAYPSIAYTGRLATDALSTMQAEVQMYAGTGSQNSTLTRWGDYSGMTVDPVDDCTFWYTTEYLSASGTFNWSTRIGNFKFPTCGVSSYTIGGSVTGLTSSGLVMAVTAGSQTVSVSAGASSYVFPTAEPTGTAYTVSVQTQPTGQTCTVSNPSGTVGTSNVTNANVSCTTNTYTIGGSVSGLTASGLVMAVTAGSQTVSVPSGATSYVFPTTEPFGSSYTVSVQTQPTGQTCSVTNASGTIGAGNVTNANVSCSTNTYTIGGTISGLTGTVQLKLDGTTPTSTQTQSFSANGSFTFTTPLQSGSGWTVSVAVQPVGQTCAVAGGSGASLSANVTTVVVTCTTNTFTLTYTAGANGTISGTSPQTVNYGGSGSLVTAVPNTGYHFVQWSDGVLTAARTDTNVQANISVTATFAIDTFTLTYTAGANGTISGTSPQTVNYGGNGSLVTAVPNTGYHFVQWSDGVMTAVRTDTNVQANISVTATFAIDTFTLTYTAGANGTISGTSPQTANYGGNGSLVTAVPNTGYHFVQWSDGVMTAARTDTNVQADITVQAQFAIDQFTVTFKDWDGSILSSQTVNYGSAATAPSSPTRTGYTFTGWDVPFSNITTDLTVTAQYTINQYTVTFKDWDGSTLSSQSVNHGGAATAPSNPTRTGYTFTGWDVPFSNITTDLTVTAQYTINQFTLTYAAGTGGSINGNSSQTVDYQGNGTAVGAVPDAGYHFVQWSDGITDNPRTDANVTADVDVTAQFAANVLAFTVQPADVAQGNTLGTVEVTEQDGSGNTIVDTATVGLTLVTACGTLDLGSVQMVDGVATLNSSQRFYTLHSGYQITATVTNPNPTPMVAVLSAMFDATASAELVFSDSFESCRP